MLGGLFFFKEKVKKKKLQSRSLSLFKKMERALSKLSKIVYKSPVCSMEGDLFCKHNSKSLL